MGYKTTNGTAAFLQNAPAPTPAPGGSYRSMRLIVPQSGVILDVANLLAAAATANLPIAPIFSFLVWPFVFDGYTPGPPIQLGAAIAAYTDAPYLWSVHYRGSIAQFMAADIVVPQAGEEAGLGDSSPNAFCDSICPVGAVVGQNISGLSNVGFRLNVHDAVTYPNAVAIVDFFMARNTQG